MKQCNGCLLKCLYHRAYASASHKEKLTFNTISIKCPCIICLVKIVCDTGCDLYEEFFNDTIADMRIIQDELNRGIK